MRKNTARSIDSDSSVVDYSVVGVFMAKNIW